MRISGFNFCSIITKTIEVGFELFLQGSEFLHVYSPPLPLTLLCLGTLGSSCFYTTM